MKSIQRHSFINQIEQIRCLMLPNVLNKNWKSPPLEMHCISVPRHQIYNWPITKNTIKCYKTNAIK